MKENMDTPIRGSEIDKAYYSTGLTKLEYFSGLVLQSMIIKSMDNRATFTTEDKKNSYDVCVDMAKKLLAALERDSKERGNLV